MDAQRATFEALGCVVEVDEPDFTGVDTAFPTLRHLAFQATYAPLAREHPEWLKDTIHWELAEAARLTGPQVADALVRQASLYHEARRFFGRHDFFVLPVTQVAPFAVDTPYPTAIDGAPDVQLHRLDAVVLVRVADGDSRHLGPGGIHGVRPSGRVADRGAASRGVGPAADGARIRAGDEARVAPAACRHACLTTPASSDRVTADGGTLQMGQLTMSGSRPYATVEGPRTTSCFATVSSTAMVYVSNAPCTTPANCAGSGGPTAMG